MQRKSFLQLAIWASWSQHLLTQALFQLAPKAFWRAELISQFFCYSNSSEKITCPSGKLKAEFNNITPKSTGPGLSDTSFFAPCGHLVACIARDFVGEDECDWADNCLFPIPFAAQLLFLHTIMLAMMSKLPAMQVVHLEVKKRNVLMIIIVFCIIVVLTITIHLQTTLTLFKLVILIKSLYK